MWRSIKRFFRRNWHYVVFFLSYTAILVYAALFLVFRRKDVEYTEDPVLEKTTPKIVMPEALTEQLRKSEDALLVIRAETAVKTEIQEAELEEIKKVEDSFERRKRLAAIIEKEYGQ